MVLCPICQTKLTEWATNHLMACVQNHHFKVEMKPPKHDRELVLLEGAGGHQAGKCFPVSPNAEF